MSNQSGNTTTQKQNAAVKDKTRGRLTTRTIAMPNDTNPAGDIFGGWVLSQMDMAAGICAGQRLRPGSSPSRWTA